MPVQRARIFFKIYHKVDIMLICMYAKNNHPRSNHLGEINQKQKKEIFTLSHPCVAVDLV